MFSDEVSIIGLSCKVAPKPPLSTASIKSRRPTYYGL